MAKWVCNVCGYVYEGDAAPEVCPQFVRLLLPNSPEQKWRDDMGC